MTIEVFAGKRKNLFFEFRNLMSKVNEFKIIKDTHRREEIIAILQERYGYTREKAESEMMAHYSEMILA
jgi:hypothetical protein